MNREISAGAVIFRREPGGGVKFLLLYHGKNYWNFPKGHIEKGEKAFGAFLREVAEETGLKPDHLKIISGFTATDRYIFFRLAQAAARSSKHKPWGQPVFKIVVFYLVETKKREVAISREHEGFAWLTASEALRIVKYKNTRAIIRRAHEFIRENLLRRASHS